MYDAADEHEDDGVMYDAEEETMDTGGKETGNGQHHVDNLRFDELRQTVQITNATWDEEMYKAERQRQKLLSNAGDITPITVSARRHRRSDSDWCTSRASRASTVRPVWCT